MSAGEWLSVAMFASFIVLIFTGFPVAWVLGGLAVVFTALGISDEEAEIHLGWRNPGANAPLHLGAILNRNDDIQVWMTADGAVYVDEQPVTSAELTALLKRKGTRAPNTTVVIKADQGVSHGRVVQVMDLAGQHGLSRLAIATEVETDLVLIEAQESSARKGGPGGYLVEPSLNASRESEPRQGHRGRAWIVELDPGRTRRIAVELVEDRGDFDCSRFSRDGHAGVE